MKSKIDSKFSIKERYKRIWEIDPTGIKRYGVWKTLYPSDKELPIKQHFCLFKKPKKKKGLRDPKPL